ncbi:MAG TPA: hypothetical protein VEF04_04830 [Blastocatellia bacterium]|nr:hypothetical protein [Blastocatellia bacterium]
MGCYITEEPEKVKLINGRLTRTHGARYIWCGRDLEMPHCYRCLGFDDFLCDYPVGEERTCDRPMCDDHRNNVAVEIDYCDTHYKEWCEYRDSGKVLEHFQNVLPFSDEKHPKKSRE